MPGTISQGQVVLFEKSNHFLRHTQPFDKQMFLPLLTWPKVGSTDVIQIWDFANRTTLCDLKVVLQRD